MAVGNLPDHEFESHPGNDPEVDGPGHDHDDAICLATVQTANYEEHGYEFFTQCGHMLKEHL